MQWSRFELINYDNVQCIEVFVSKIRYCPLHFHHDFEMALILSGEVEWVVETTRYHLKVGDFIMINPNQIHEIRACGQDAIILLTQFPRRLWLQLFPLWANLYFDESVIRSEEALLCSYGGRAIGRMDLLYTDFADCFLSKNSTESMIGIGLFCMILDKVQSRLMHRQRSFHEANARSRDAERLGRFMTFVHQHYSHPLKLADFAETEGLTLSYTSRFIRRVLNMSFQEYLKSVRVLHAKTLLSQPEKSLVDVCFESGFSDVRYLNTAFKEELGMSAAEYRKYIIEESGLHLSLGRELGRDGGERREEIAWRLKPDEAKYYLLNYFTAFDGQDARGE